MKKLLFSMLLFGAVSLTVGDSLLGFWRNDSTTVEIPNYCGMQEAELEAPDWLPITVEYRHDEAPAGEVILQEPRGGTQKKLGKGRKIPLTLTVSMGKEKLTLPALAGKDAREASAALRALGLAVREEETAAAAPGVVLTTEPQAGSLLLPGDEVVLFVGRAASAESITVPNLIGLSRGSALLQLFLSELTVSEVTEEASDQPTGSVIRQSPAPGSQVPKGTPIRLIVSHPETTEESDPNSFLPS